MSYVVESAGDKYRGGYASSAAFDPTELRVATSTFENYISGTVLLVFLIFFVFIFLTGFTYLLMSYARFCKQRKPKGGFYDPPPMILRYPSKVAGGGGAYSITSSRPESSILQRNLPSSLSQAASQHTEVL